MAVGFARPIAIVATFLAAIAAGAPHFIISPSSAQVQDKAAVLDHRGSTVIRRERPRTEAKEAEEKVPEYKTMEALLESNTIGHEEKTVKAKQPDMYVMIGNNKCNGDGGFWKHYKLDAVKPGRYDFCAAACDSKDECIGFDVGYTGCNMYTQKAIAVDTWPSVQSHNGVAFAGENDHDAYPETPFNLTVGDNTYGVGKTFQCYRKTNFVPKESYYWLIGAGTCSGGGIWKRYAMIPGNFSACSDACDQRDECVGFDVSQWAVSDTTVQRYQDYFETDQITTSGCFMYTQKPVYGMWPHVQDLVAHDGNGDHDRFAPTPYDLKTGYVAQYEVKAPGETETPAKCYGKTHWVGLDSYYMRIGQSACDHGGKWKHYVVELGRNDDGTWKQLVPIQSLVGVTDIHAKRHNEISHCQACCDMKDACLGFDWHEGDECHLYTRVPIPHDGWRMGDKIVKMKRVVGAGGDGNTDTAFHGTGAHELLFPQQPFDLKPNLDPPVHTKACYAKTHYETPTQNLDVLDASR